MHGRVVSYDIRTRFGILADSNGVQHHFPATEWLGSQGPQVGQPVEFNVIQGSAVGVTPSGPAPSNFGGGFGGTGFGGSGFAQPGNPMGSFLNAANEALSGAQHPFIAPNMNGGPPGFWQFYFSPTGRVSRGQYWRRFMLPFGAVGLVVFGLLIYGVIMTLHQHLHPVYLLILFGILILKLTILGWVGFVMHIKRYHDLGMSWGSAWIVDNFMPFGQDWMTWRVLCEQGTIGPNQFGPDPREYGG